jgi:hypothetical protein
MRQRIEPDYQALVRRLLSGGYTTVTLAREVGLSQAAISRVSTGKQRGLTAPAAMALIELAGGRIELPPADAPVPVPAPAAEPAAA